MWDSFVFYRSFHEAVKALPAEMYKEIMTAIIEYALDGTTPEISPVAQCAFLLAKPQIDANNKRREAGSKGGKAKSKPEADGKQTKANPKQLEAKASKSKQTEATVKRVEANYNVNVNVNDNDIPKAFNNTTGEPVPAPPEADCESIPLNDGTEWKPTADLFAEWERLYPGIDVRQKIRDMRGWCLSNPTRRKTRRGVQAFVTGWLSREQNKAPATAQEKRKTRFDNFPSHGTDYDAIMWGMVAGGEK